LEQWINQYIAYKGDCSFRGTTNVILGNKVDLEDKRQVSYEEASDFCAKHEFYYFETCTFQPETITAVFEEILEEEYLKNIIDSTVRKVDLMLGACSNALSEVADNISETKTAASSEQNYDEMRSWSILNVGKLKFRFPSHMHANISPSDHTMFILSYMDPEQGPRIISTHSFTYGEFGVTEDIVVEKMMCPADFTIKFISRPDVKKFGFKACKIQEMVKSTINVGGTAYVEVLDSSFRLYTSPLNFTMWYVTLVKLGTQLVFFESQAGHEEMKSIWRTVGLADSIIANTITK